MTITYRSEKGSRLTRDELDANFRHLEEAVQTLQALPLGTVIEDITVSGSTITFHVNEGTGDRDIGPFALPVAQLRARGEWQPATEYFYLDVVTVSSEGVYLVNIDHTSAAEFDAAALDDVGTAGDLLYSILLPSIDTETVMYFKGAWAATTTYAENDVFTESLGLFVSLQAHTSAASFDPAASNGDGALYRQIAGPIRSPVSTVTAATYTLELDDENTYIRFTAAGGCSITVPSNSSVAFATGAEIQLCAATSGQVSLAPGTGVTINIPDGFDQIARMRGGVMTLKKVATNEWDLFGDLEDASSA